MTPRTGSFAIVVCTLLLCAIPAKHAFTAAPKNNPSDGNAPPSTTDTSQKKSTDSSQPATNPSPSAPSSGPIESQILAYEALENRAKLIAPFIVTIVDAQEATKTPPNPAVNLIILDPTSMNLAPAFRSFQFQARLLRDNFCTALHTPKNAAIEAREFAFPTAGEFTAAAGALTAVLALFKETRTVTPSSITMPDEALVAAVAQVLRSQRSTLSIYYPSEFPIGLGDLQFDPAVLRDAVDPIKTCDFAADDSKIPAYGLLITLQFLRSTAATEAAALNAKSDKDKASWSNKLAALTAAIQQFGTLATALTSTNSSTNLSPWDAIVRGEQIARVLTDHSYVVQLKVQSAGGETVTLDGAFFLTGASYFYSGGAIFTAIVYDNKGSLKAAKNFWMMTGDQKRKNFTNRVNP
jgi:hypothetical protein